MYTFSIADPFIEPDPVRDYYIGETITISGRTNVPAGEELLIVFTHGFQKDYGDPEDLANLVRQVTIEKGPASVNHFSADFNSSATRPGEHLVKVSSFYKRGDQDRGSLV